VELQHKVKAASTDYSAIEGVLKRLWTFRHGAMTRLYGRGSGAVALENLGWAADGRGGVVVLEGGATEMDAYAKSAILSLMAWHLYTDAVRQARDLTADAGRPRTIMVFEEANKIITGVAGGETSADAPVATDIHDTMARDAGKYGFRMVYIAQSIAEPNFPPGIVSSCNNLFYGRLKGAKDRDTALPTYGRSERGFHDLEYLKHIGRLEIGRFIVMLGLSTERREVEPFLIQTLMIPAAAPTNAEIASRFGAVYQSGPVVV
jgi:hypothetical protein